MSDAPRASDIAHDPTDPYQRQAQTFPHLTFDQIERASLFGAVEELAAGTVLFERGDRLIDFFIVLEGAIEIYEHRNEERHVFCVHDPRQFTGDVDLFNDRSVVVGGRMREAGRLVRIPRAKFRKLLAAEPDIGELVTRAFILRRVGILVHDQAAVRLIGTRHSPDTHRLQRFMDRNGYPFRFLDADHPDSTGHVRGELASFGLGRADLPVVICPNDQVGRNPSNAELARCLGLFEEIDDKVHDVVVVGAGPAGLAAAVYAASEGLATLVLEAEAPGGQAGTSSKIENYLGFPTGISGGALAGRAQVQAQKFGAKLALPRRAVALECDERPYRVVLDDGTRVRTETVVIATGARYRSLDLPNCGDYEGKGIHYAATELEAALCHDEEAVVVGGGNSAGQAAVFLSRHATHVHVLVRGARLADSMSDYLVGRIMASARITLRTKTAITALAGDGRLEEVSWRCDDGSGDEPHRIGNVFLMIGAIPNTDWLRGCLELDDKGFVRTGVLSDDGRAPYLLETSKPGIFAVGDVRADSVKRVASAVGEGSIAVQYVHRVLAERRPAP
jgi:thioredoxin reductase (NADPH)